MEQINKKKAMYEERKSRSIARAEAPTVQKVSIFPFQNQKNYIFVKVLINVRFLQLKIYRKEDLFCPGLGRPKQLSGFHKPNWKRKPKRTNLTISLVLRFHVFFVG